MNDVKNNYRITFHDGPMDKNYKTVDIYANDSNDALDKAYKMPEAKDYYTYTDVMVEKIPTEPSTIGVEIECYNTIQERKFTDRIFIKAQNEQQAINYYNKNYNGGRFGLYANKTIENGHSIRGRVIRTYFTSLPGYDADATISDKNIDLDEKISKAEKQKNHKEITLKFKEKKIIE